MFISKTLIFLHFEKEGKATGEVLFFFFVVLDDERDILLAEHSRTTLHSQPIRAKTRTKRDSLARVHSRTLTALMS